MRNDYEKIIANIFEGTPETEQKNFKHAVVSILIAKGRHYLFVGKFELRAIQKGQNPLMRRIPQLLYS